MQREREMHRHGCAPKRPSKKSNTGSKQKKKKEKKTSQEKEGEVEEDFGETRVSTSP